MTTKKIASTVYDWVDERLGLADLAAFARHKTVPVHAQSGWYYWGGITLFLFIVQCFTGVLLLVYYRPGAEAYKSVHQITFTMHFGWLVRSIHSWSANLMIFSILVHMFSVFFMKAYRKPRELGWLSGFALLGLATVFGFSGYLLPMDELSYFATKVGLEIPASLPVVGQTIANMLRGGTEVGEFTVQRFFALHVVVLPAVFIPILGFHLWLVQKHGNAAPPSYDALPEAEKKSEPFFPNFFRKDLAMWIISLNILALLASVFPWSLGAAADPLKSAPAGIHPEWYFMSPFELLKMLGVVFSGPLAEYGELVGMLIFTVGIVLWLLIPFYDNSTESGRRGRIAHYFGLFVVFALLATTAIGYWVIR
jgi:quinol-cytochrome oxidoreductase complex cytochrome b subunit